jgi:uracil-DNA glycosylase
MWYTTYMDKVWIDLLQRERIKPYYRFMKSSFKPDTITPAPDVVFKALELTGYEQVKVVMIGEEPYSEKGKSNGLTFGCNFGTTSELTELSKQLGREYGLYLRDKTLKSWAKQGCLLLNTALTVNIDEKKSHLNLGWATFVGEVLKLCSNSKNHIVFVLFGESALQFANCIDFKRHTVITLDYPRAFNNTPVHYFTKINDILQKNKQSRIDWFMEEP